VIGVIVLRFTSPELARPYRVWAYPLPPVLFSVITIWMMIYLLRSRPTESLCGLATVVAGFALYYLTGKTRAPFQ
jgi:APA family basic amino acid/polyamine antiporter